MRMQMKKEREQKCIYNQIRSVYRMKLRGYIKKQKWQMLCCETKKFELKKRIFQAKSLRIKIEKENKV